MKVTLIGPVKPYRGGIAHFNDCLIAEFQAQHTNYEIISWKKRYPNFLYPGQFQYDPKKKDVIKNNPIFALNVLNPFTWFKVRNKLINSSSNVIIYNWVTPFLAPIIIVISLFIKKKKILICHNVLPHERRRIDKFVTKIVFNQFDKFIVHAHSEYDSIKDLIKDDSKYIKILNMPEIGNFGKNENKSKNQKINKLVKHILFFGYIRAYKGLDILIKAMALLNQTNKGEYHLTIAGEFWEKKSIYTNLIDDLDINHIITIKDNYIPDDQVSQIFENCDLVVLPYKNATQSGIAPIALSLNKAVLTSNVGGMKDLNAKNPNLYILKGELNPKNLSLGIKKIMSTTSSKRKNIKCAKGTTNKNGWEHYYSDLLS